MALALIVVVVDPPLGVSPVKLAARPALPRRLTTGPSGLPTDAAVIATGHLESSPFP